MHRYILPLSEMPRNPAEVRMANRWHSSEAKAITIMFGFLAASASFAELSTTRSPS